MKENDRERGYNMRLHKRANLSWKLYEYLVKVDNERDDGGGGVETNKYKERHWKACIPTQLSPRGYVIWPVANKLHVVFRPGYDGSEITQWISTTPVCSGRRASTSYV